MIRLQIHDFIPNPPPDHTNEINKKVQTDKDKNKRQQWMIHVKMIFSRWEEEEPEEEFRKLKPKCPQRKMSNANPNSYCVTKERQRN
jgi:hypothetical protein